MEDLTGAWRSRTLAAAVELDVFSHIAEGKRTAKDVAGAAGASPAHGPSFGCSHRDRLFAQDRQPLRPAAISATFLVRGKTAYMGAMAQAMSLTWDAWKDLTEVVKSGRSAEAVNVAEKAKEFFPKLVASIFPGNFAASKAAVSNLPEKERRQIHRFWTSGLAPARGRWHLPSHSAGTRDDRGFPERLQSPESLLKNSASPLDTNITRRPPAGGFRTRCV